MSVRIIAAMTSNRTIGKGGTIPWKSSVDMAHFKSLTQGNANEQTPRSEWNVCIMGRKTFESLPVPLEYRHVVVLTRQEHPSVPDNMTEPTTSVQFAASIADALQKADDLTRNDIWICGGEQVYEDFIYESVFSGLVETIELTEIPTNLIEGDTFFPHIHSAWKLANTVVKKGLIFHSYRR